MSTPPVYYLQCPICHEVFESDKQESICPTCGAYTKRVKGIKGRTLDAEPVLV